MTFSPFWLASENKPYDPESYARGWNYGAQLNFMVPLNGSLTEQCKSMAIRLEETLRLEYELTRVAKCAELMKKGFTLRYGSSFEHLCSDVVPIVLQPITSTYPMADVKEKKVEVKKEVKVEAPKKVYGKESIKSTRGTLDKR